MGFLIALFSIAALAWMLPIIQAGRLLRVAMVLLVVGTVFGPHFFAIEGPIQFSLDRILWLAMLGLALIHWRLGNTRLPEFTRIDWLLLGFLGCLFLGALRGGPVPTGSSPTARWVFYIVMPIGVYMMARLVEIRASDIRVLSGVTIGLAVYLAVTAVLEVSGMHALVFPKHILDPEAWQFYGRGRGPLLNPIGNGVIISFGFVATALGFIRAGRHGKVLYALLAGVLLYGAYVTLTRSVWLGALAAAGVLVFIYSPRWVRVLGLSTAVLLGGAMTMGLKEQLLSLKRDKDLSAAESARSIELRPLLAVVAWEMFKDRPIIGHGFGHYFEHNRRYHDNRSYGLPLDRVREYDQHNTFLSIVVDAGLIGILLFLSVLSMLSAIAWQLAREAGSPETRTVGGLLLGMMAVYVCNSMFHNLIPIPMVHMFLLFVGGCAVTIFQKGLATDPATDERVIQARRPLMASAR